MLVDKTLAFRKPFGEHYLPHPTLYFHIFLRFVAGTRTVHTSYIHNIQQPSRLIMNTSAVTECSRKYARRCAGCAGKKRLVYARNKRPGSNEAATHALSTTNTNPGTDNTPKPEVTHANMSSVRHETR